MNAMQPLSFSLSLTHKHRKTTAIDKNGKIIITTLTATKDKKIKLENEQTSTIRVPNSTPMVCG